MFDFLKKLRPSKIGYGKSKKSGGHDHRTNKGPDRTPKQLAGDKKKKK